MVNLDTRGLFPQGGTSLSWPSRGCPGAVLFFVLVAMWWLDSWWLTFCFYWVLLVEAAGVEPKHPHDWRGFTAKRATWGPQGTTCIVTDLLDLIPF